MVLAMRTTDKNTPLSEPFSLYLDLTRFLAALMVVFAHYIQSGIVSGAESFLFPNMGREAVVIFFVLSGFVIAFVTENRSASAREYVAARLGRIYSVAIPTLIIAWILASAVGGLDSYQLAKPYIYIPLHLLFLGQSWSLSEVPPMMAPFWSLCYEVWYYALFGVAYYLKGWKRTAALLTVLAIMGFKLWLLLPVWLSGVALYHLQHRIALTQRAARIGLVFTVLLLLMYNLTGTEQELRALGIAIWPFSSFALGSSDRFLADYVVCALVVINFLCARHAGLRGLVQYGSQIRAVASYTFTLYLSHMLVLLVWLKLYSHNSNRWLDIVGLTLCIGLATVALAQLTERRKDKFRRPIDWILRQSMPFKA
jgi:peptidoglycan/LPS O-acetylase OafA/YrhL